MVTRRGAIGAACIGFALAVVHRSPGYVTGRLIEGAWDWMPQLGTIGETLVLYHHTVDLMSVLLGFGAVLALGYGLGRTVDLRRQYRTLVLSIGLGGLGGYLLVHLLIAALAVLTQGWSVIDEVTLLGGVGVSIQVLTVPLQFAMVGLAGAALAHLGGHHGDTGRAVKHRRDVGHSPD